MGHRIPDRPSHDNRAVGTAPASRRQDKADRYDPYIDRRILGLRTKKYESQHGGHELARRFRLP